MTGAASSRARGRAAECSARLIWGRQFSDMDAASTPEFLLTAAMVRNDGEGFGGPCVLARAVLFSPDSAGPWLGATADVCLLAVGAGCVLGIGICSMATARKGLLQVGSFHAQGCMLMAWLLMVTVVVALELVEAWPLCHKMIAIDDIPFLTWPPSSSKLSTCFRTAGPSGPHRNAAWSALNVCRKQHLNTCYINFTTDTLLSENVGVLNVSAAMKHVGHLNAFG